MSVITVVDADYKNKDHAQSIVLLMDQYAQDPMGGNSPLSDYARDNLANELAKRPHAFTVLCYVDSEPAGLINCFEAFSTFKCQPLVNIHDVVVHANFRGQGISLLMLERVEQIARERGCCKLTLEVLEGNAVAQNAYRKFGFVGYELDPAMGQALFWEKVVK